MNAAYRRLVSVYSIKKRTFKKRGFYQPPPVWICGNAMLKANGRSPLLAQKKFFRLAEHATGKRWYEEPYLVLDGASA